MVHILRFIAALVRWLRRSPAEREAEIVYLRQQLIVLKRTAPARPRLKATDRLIFLCLYRLFPSLLDASIIFKPETLLRWHRTGFRLFWRWKSRRRIGVLLSRLTSEASFDGSIERTHCGERPVSTASCSSSVSRSLSRPWPGACFNDVARHHRVGRPSSAITPRTSPPSICLSCRPRLQAALWISDHPP
jgi:hypothetical protein